MDHLALIALFGFFLTLTIGIAAIYIALRIKFPNRCQQRAVQGQKRKDLKSCWEP